MNDFIYFIGQIVVIFLIIYAVLYFVYYILKLKVDSVSANLIPMPALRPIHIPTKGQKNVICKLIVFIFEVRKWEVVENWHYTLEDGTQLLVPKGFIFDGASIPRPFWAVLNPIGLLLIPGLLHDYAYKYDQLWQINADRQVVPYMENKGKEYWDHLFKQVGKEVNGFFLINAIAWLAVAVGGSGAWEEHRKAGLKAEKLG